MCGRTRGQAPLCPHRRPPRPRYSVVGVCRRGGLHFGRHTAQNLDITASKRGNCTNRATTRRRHAAGRLLMPQNPHRQPDIHPGAEGGGAESTGALRDTSLATAPAGDDPTTASQISHVISPRSLFKITRKRCNSNDVNSTFELIAGELRATLMGGGRAVSIHAGKASPTEPGQGHGWPGPRRRLLPIRRNTPSVISQPVLIGRNALDQVESRLTGRMPR